MNCAPETEIKKIQGIPISPGVVVAPAKLYRARTIDIPTYEIIPDDADVEYHRLEQARNVTRNQLSALRNNLTEKAEDSIIDGHIMVLDDELIANDTLKEIFESNHNAEWAVRNVANKYISILQQADDPYFRERATDIADVSRRLIRNLQGIVEELPGEWDTPCIIVAENLTPSEAIALPKNVVKGVALDTGSVTSHAALLLKSQGIPSVFGLGNISSIIKSGELLILNGSDGYVIPKPSEQESHQYETYAQERQTVIQSLEQSDEGPTYTTDNFRVKILGNLENPDGITDILKSKLEGVGLFRTEYLWLTNGKQVDEKTQQAAYERVINAMEGRTVVIRAFDLGGDKFIGDAGLSKTETNPFLGMRSLRYLLQNPDIFKTQIRAILRASHGSDLRILIPMVTITEEFIAAKTIIHECITELEKEGAKIEIPKIGAMIEVPSAALTADAIAREADFLSIGTNDLTQYTLAADRTNDHVAHLYLSTHPSVLRLIKMTAEAATKAGKSISVCGDMASNPEAALLLLGMRINALGISAPSASLIRHIISKASQSQAAQLVEAALHCDSSENVLKLVRDHISEIAPVFLQLLKK